MKKIWFKNKTYGWGWTPASWEGWVVLFTYLASVVWIFRDIDSRSHSGSDTLIGFFVPMIAMTAVLIFIAYRTGEKPEWRWAGKPIRWTKKS